MKSRPSTTAVMEIFPLPLVWNVPPTGRPPGAPSDRPKIEAASAADVAPIPPVLGTELEAVVVDAETGSPIRKADDEENDKKGCFEGRRSV